MAQPIQPAFDRDAAVYDRSRRQLIPCFDDFYGTVLDLLPGTAETRLRVIDLGAGTGLLASLIARERPQAEITLVDVSGQMLQQARQRFCSQLPGRFAFVEMDLAGGDLPGRFDLAVSALAIHHLGDQAKRRLFHRVLGTLSPGGLFIHAEQVLGATPAVERRLEKDWLEAVRRAGVNENDLEQALERMEQDRTVPLEVQLHWLREAGFADVECWFRKGRFAVYSGMRPVQETENC